MQRANIFEKFVGIIGELILKADEFDIEILTSMLLKDLVYLICNTGNTVNFTKSNLSIESNIRITQTNSL